MSETNWAPVAMPLSVTVFPVLPVDPAYTVNVVLANVIGVAPLTTGAAVSDVPVLGALFRNTDQNSTKSELVILIKATIVKDSASWDQNLLDSQRHILDLDPHNAPPLK